MLRGTDGLEHLRVAVGAAHDELSERRRRIAGLFAEAGETDVVGPSLSAVEADLGAAGCEIGAAAAVAAADAAANGQTGWRVRLGLVDDVLLDMLWVNDVSRAVTGRDLNTGMQVDGADRVASGIFLIPFAKLAKGAKLLKFGDDAAALGAGARTAGRVAVTNADEAVAVLGTLKRGKSKSSRIRVVDSVAELDDLFDDLAREGRHVTTRGPWPTYELADATTVVRRNRSASGGPTLDIILPDNREWKVHVDPWPQ